MKHLLIASLLLLGACQPTPEPVEEVNVDETLAKLNETQVNLREAETKAAQAATTATTKAKSSVDDASARWSCTDPEDHECIETGPHDVPRLCWQDYCPCDDTVTALDGMLCRNARGGIEMSDDQWAIGAQARDSKREGDRLNAEMDGIIADMRAQ